MKATVTKSEVDGKFYIVPLSAGVSGVPFKEKWQAESVANALNDAYQRGRKTLAGELRDLIGAAKEED